MSQLDTFGMTELTEAEMIDTNGGVSALEIGLYAYAWALAGAGFAAWMIAAFVGNVIVNSGILEMDFGVELGPWPWEV